MVTIWPNGIIPCSWNHIYHLVLPRVPTLHPSKSLTYPWSSGYQPFEIWHQTFCTVGVLDRAFFWPLFGISSLTTNWIYCFFKSIFSGPFLVFFFSLNFNSSLHLFLDLLQSLLTHLVNMWTFFFLYLFYYHSLTSSYIYLCSNIPYYSYLWLIAMWSHDLFTEFSSLNLLPQNNPPQKVLFTDVWLQVSFFFQSEI